MFSVTLNTITPDELITIDYHWFASNLGLRSLAHIVCPVPYSKIVGTTTKYRKSERDKQTYPSPQIPRVVVSLSLAIISLQSESLEQSTNCFALIQRQGCEVKRTFKDTFDYNSTPCHLSGHHVESSAKATYISMRRYRVNVWCQRRILVQCHCQLRDGPRNFITVDAIKNSLVSQVPRSNRRLRKKPIEGVPPIQEECRSLLYWCCYLYLS